MPNNGSVAVRQAHRDKIVMDLLGQGPKSIKEVSKIANIPYASCYQVFTRLANNKRIEPVSYTTVQSLGVSSYAWQIMGSIADDLPTYARPSDNNIVNFADMAFAYINSNADPKTFINNAGHAPYRIAVRLMVWAKRFGEFLSPPDELVNNYLKDSSVWRSQLLAARGTLQDQLAFVEHLLSNPELYATRNLGKYAQNNKKISKAPLDQFEAIINQLNAAEGR